MTLGPTIASALAERMRGAGAVVSTFGRVPMFYYLLHIPTIHLARVRGVAHSGGRGEPVVVRQPSAESWTGAARVSMESGPALSGVRDRRRVALYPLPLVRGGEGSRSHRSASFPLVVLRMAPRSSRQRYKGFVEDYKRRRLDDETEARGKTPALLVARRPVAPRATAGKEKGEASRVPARYLRWLRPYRYAVGRLRARARARRTRDDRAAVHAVHCRSRPAYQDHRRRDAPHAPATGRAAFLPRSFSPTCSAS